MKLSLLLERTKNDIFKGELSSDIEVSSLVYDSRQCKAGSLFFATDGTHTDGHLFISSAIEKGAVGVVIDRALDVYSPGVVYIKVNSPRRALAPFSAAFYNYPADKMKVIGVTGTDGKSSTVSLIHQLLELAGYKSGFLSTVAYQAGSEVIPNPYRQSTPEPPELQWILNEMVQAGTEYAVIETTSHGLSEKNNRLGSISFDAAVFTNVTTEHLDFHGTVEQYRKDKSNLFKMLNKKSTSFGVINKNDPWHQIYIEACTGTPLTWGIENNEATYAIKAINPIPNGFTFNIEEKGQIQPASINLSGIFNVDNSCAALITVANLLNKPISQLIPLLQKLKPIKGRMNQIQHQGNFRLIVDYAHTPGSFETLLPSIRKETQGQVITLFGSAGERDKGKRPIQGSIADQFSDIIILTDEDPRLEDSMQIIDDIAEGCHHKIENKNLFKIPDRYEAICRAVNLAQEGDTILLLGKGHESSMIYPDGKRHWDEEKKAREALATRDLIL